jgi:superfamily II DNA or RNA helicase
MIVTDHRTDNAPSVVETVESVTMWARDVLDLLNEVERVWRASTTDAEDRLAPHVVPLSGDSVLARGVVALRLPDPGTPSAQTLARSLSSPANLRQLLEDVAVHAPVLTAQISDALDVIASARPRLLGRRREEAAVLAAANRLARLKHWATSTGYASRLTMLVSKVDAHDAQPAGIQLTDALSTLAPVLGAVPPSGEYVLSATDAADLVQVVRQGHHVLEVRRSLEQQVIDAFGSVQERMVRRQLQDLPVSTLQAASRGDVRVTAFEKAGLTSVQQVLEKASVLGHIAGVGAQTARAAEATARALQRECREQLGARVDWDASDSLATRLVVALHRMLELDEHLDAHREALERVVTEVEPLDQTLGSGGAVAILHRHSPRRGADVVRALREHARWARTTGMGEMLGARQDPDDARAAWDDFSTRVSTYQGLLGQVVGMEADVDAAQGHLPTEIVRAVESQALDTAFLRPALRASLRGYQSFGARYAVVQRKVLLGDEMGLGKTIQALTVMSHLASQDKKHFLVVAPPAVIVNWLKEVHKHSTLDGHRVHGVDRERALRRWKQLGGVAVTSYGLLRNLPLEGVEPSLLVVDEAHMVKNPGAQRSQAVQALVQASERALLMTGTPLDNKVDDFTNLVGYLQPDVVDNIDAAAMVLGAQKFREAVAPVYLRRSSSDVLQELPELVESEEWLDHSKVERAAYLDALVASDFHRMRHLAITANPQHSSKLERLEELIHEAMSNHRKVLVYSFYRDVLEEVRRRLGDDLVIGVISGSTPPDQRQRLVDEFTDSQRPLVLVSQIEAGGVGLNLQAASVVILCEPQVKPSLENQAIKRAHRMGQAQAVQVHRLLTTDSVDERMLEILERKTALFDQLVEQSEVATASVEATDVSEAALRKEVLAREQERLANELRGRMSATAEATLSAGGSMTPTAADRSQASPEAVPGDLAHLEFVASEAELALLRAINHSDAAASRLDVEVDGVPLGLTWPKYRLTVRSADLAEDEVETLVGLGWTVTELDVGAVRTALAQARLR